MDSSFSSSKQLHDFFKVCFRENCEIDEEEVTIEEEKTLEELSPYEVFQNFKDLVNDLLQFKRKFKKTDKGGLETQCEQLEILLQKLEAEARIHYGIEHQLKIHIDTCQSKVEELEKAIIAYSIIIEKQEKKINDYENEIKRLKKTKENYHDGLEEKIKLIEKRFKEEISSLVENHKQENGRDMDRTVFKTFDHKRVLRNDKSALRFEEFVKLKSMLEDKSKELEVMKEKYKKVKSDEKTSTVERKANMHRTEYDIKFPEAKNFATNRENGFLRKSATNLLEMMKKNYKTRAVQKLANEKSRDISTDRRDHELLHIRSISDQIRSESLPSYRGPKRNTGET
ncbi:unnamed protein product [Blepharisma stoltei]|uniref:Uncharacterized protein n=1 Tax=Blepharisma stoltei TaxID=1481888 RepID=A0AAU9K3J1_9CILI|nr:unnamed protein product [Blepharisma stoltei]